MFYKLVDNETIFNFVCRIAYVNSGAIRDSKILILKIMKWILLRNNRNNESAMRQNESLQIKK